MQCLIVQPLWKMLRYYCTLCTLTVDRLFLYSVYEQFVNFYASARTRLAGGDMMFTTCSFVHLGQTGRWRHDVHNLSICPSGPDWQVETWCSQPIHLSIRARLAGGDMMFTTCPFLNPFICPFIRLFVRSFICYQICEHDMLKTNKAILMQISTCAPQDEGMKWLILGSVGQRWRSHEAGDRFGVMAEASSSTPVGRVAFIVNTWMLTSAYGCYV